VGKIVSKVKRAYIAGLIDADGAIMALIEHHQGKRFGFRVRIEMKLSQKKAYILKWLKNEVAVGSIRKNRTTFDWLTRDQKEIHYLLIQLKPFLRIKRQQAKLALRILAVSVNSKKDLLKAARLADALSLLNPRSKNRRKNFAAMIEEAVSPND